MELDARYAVGATVAHLQLGIHHGLAGGIVKGTDAVLNIVLVQEAQFPQPALEVRHRIAGVAPLQRGIAVTGGLKVYCGVRCGLAVDVSLQ